MKTALVTLFSTCVLTAQLQAQVPSGNYVLDGSGAEVSAAIERAASDFNFIARPLARRQLREANPVVHSLSIQQAGDSIEVALNNHWVLWTKPGITQEWRGFNNERLQVSTTLDGGALTNTFIAPAGQRQNTYVLRPDGELELVVRISSPRLKHPIEYRELFHRAIP